jgi:hypothetical protein
MAWRQLFLSNVAPQPDSQEGSQEGHWVDGQGGHMVKCSVRGTSTFSLSGEMKSSTDYFKVTGMVQAGGTGTADVSAFDPGEGILLRDPQCTVSVTGGYAVEPGAIWASFACSSLRAAEDAYLWCAAEGTIIFENCDG